MYNLTNVTDANNFFEITKAVNDLSGGYVGIFLLASIFLLIMIIFKQYEEDTKANLLTASVITSIIGILFWGIGLIAWNILIYPIIIFVAAAIIYKFTGD